MKTKIKFGLIVILFLSCKNGKKAEIFQPKSTEQNITANTTNNTTLECDNIPGMFHSLEEAKEFVRSLEWTYSDNASFDGSWILSAEYYSCDKETGFYIMCTEQKCYIHDFVEIDVWEDFKSSDDPGKFYQDSMKDIYQMYDRIE